MPIATAISAIPISCVRRSPACSTAPISRSAPSSSIPQHFAAGPVAPGEPPGMHAENWGRDATPEFPSTSNIAVIDRAGNALAMTTTIEFAFGSRI